MVHMKLGIGLGVWVLIWYDLGRLKLGKNCRKNPENWVCEGVPRHDFSLPRQDSFCLMGAAAQGCGAAAQGKFQGVILGDFRPLLRGFGGRHRGIVLRF